MANDASFDFGSDELFPLEKSNSNDTKAPKGAKGYFKNVVKSVGNLGVKLGKSLYPEAFQLSSDIKESLGESGTKINYTQIKDKIKNTVNSVKSTAKELAEDVGKDIKGAIRTGYFVKSQADMDEEMNKQFADSFGLGDDGDLDSFDFGSDFGDFDDGDSEEGKPRRPRLSAAEATIKSNRATARLLMRANRDNQSTIIGATQTQIRHETRLFAQQMEMQQLFHQQKMKVMKNIATNLAKTVEQNNLSLRAQMEFSAKSLAFSQDLAAMLKEIRDAQWTLAKPKTPKETQKTMYQKIFGNGSVNLGAWGKQFKENFKANAFGGTFSMIDSAKSALEMMTSMGMSPAQAIKQMGGDMIFDAIAKGGLSYKNQRGLDMVNQKIAGLPSAFNRMLGSIVSGDNKLVNKLSDYAQNKGGILGKIAGITKERIQDFAQAGYMKDTVSYKSGRFDMGPPEEIHPFDNKAHWALTEVIPGFLSKISAGVNHTEQEVYDYSLHRFIKSRDLNQRYELAAQEVYDSTRGIRDIEDSLSGSVSDTAFQKSLKDKVKSLNMKVKKSKYVNPDGTVNEMEFSKEFPKMLKSFMHLGITLDQDALKKCKMSYSNGHYIYGEYSEQILADTAFSDEYEKYVATTAFVRAVNQMRPNANSSDEERELWTNLTTSMESYNTRLSEANMAVEEQNAQMGSVTANEQTIYKRETKKQIEELQYKMRAAQAKLANAKSMKNDKYIGKYAKEVQEYQSRIIKLKQSSSFGTEDINAGLDDMTSNGRFGNYAITSLEDDSTNGLVRNIYNLLLTGLDVYPHGNDFERYKEHETLTSKARSTLGTRQKEKADAIKTAADERQYIELDGPYPKRQDEQIDWLKTNGIARVEDVTDPKTNRTTTIVKEWLYTGKLYYKGVGGKWNSIKCDPKAQFQVGTTYYFSTSEKRAYEQKSTREYQRQSKSWMHENILSKIPIVGKAFAVYDKLVGKVNDVAGDTLGDIFYAENNGTTKKAVKKAKSAAEAAKTKAGEVKKNAEEFYDKNIKGKTLTQIAKDGINAVKKVDPKALVAAGLVSGKELVDAGITKGQTSIKELYEKGLIAEEKLVGEGAEKLKGMIGEENYNKIVEDLGLASDFVSDKVKKAKDKASRAARIGKVKAGRGMRKVKGLAEHLIGKEKMDAIEGAIGEGKAALSSIKDGVVGGVTGGLSKFFSPDGENDVNGDTAEEMEANKVEKQKLKEEQKKNGFLSKIYGVITNFAKHGIGLDKKTMDGIDESNEKSAEKTGSWLEQGMDFIGGKGFKNSKLGKSAVGKLLRKGRVMLGRSGIVKGGAINTGKIASSIAGKVGGLVGGAGGVTGAAGGGAAAAGGVIKKALETIGKIPQLAKGAGKSVFGTVKSKLLGFVKQFAPKLSAKISAVSAASATLIVELSAIALGFTKGMANAKQNFKVGHGMSITWGMRFCSGVAEALNAGLLGIPGLIAQWLGKQNVAMWLFELVGSRADKLQLELYKKYNEQRSVIFGIKQPDALVAFENRFNMDNAGTQLLSGMKALGQNVLSVLSFGLADNDDEKNCRILGFKTVNIYKYWKEKKFKYLNDLRIRVAEKYGGIKAIEKMTAIDPNSIKNTDQSEDPNAVQTDADTETENAAFENQAKYRTEYLNEARKWVLDEHLAWLTSECTVEKFKKYSGESDAGEELAQGVGGRLKRMGKNLWLSTPLGMLTKAGRNRMANHFKGVLKGAAAVGNWFKNIFKKYDLDPKQQQMMTDAGAAIQQVQTSVDPTFFGENDAEKVNPTGSSEGAIDSNNVINVGQNGGAESAGEGYFVKVEKDKSNESKVKQLVNAREGFNNGYSSEKSTRKNKEHYDLNKMPKTQIMNSIAQDFADKFGNELNKRLDILNEMHKEQVRHNSVAEDFFKSALAFMLEIAKKSGQVQTSSRLQDMISEISK